VFFDNGSTLRNHLDSAKMHSRISFVESSVNLGLWSAVNWILENYENRFGRKHQYIYIVESDLVHKALTPIVNFPSFLTKYSKYSMVRTEEFSVCARWRYDKRLSFLPYPFHQEFSAISLFNQVDGKKAYFRKVHNERRLYASNLHAKLPGFHSFTRLKTVFQELRDLEDFAESDFFHSYQKLSREVAILDRGIWRSSTSAKTNSESSASWATPKYDSLGYLRTRSARIYHYQSADLRLISGDSCHET